MDEASLLSTTVQKRSHNIAIWALHYCDRDIIWSQRRHSIDQVVEPQCRVPVQTPSHLSCKQRSPPSIASNKKNNIWTRIWRKWQKEKYIYKKKKFIEVFSSCPICWQGGGWILTYTVDVHQGASGSSVFSHVELMLSTLPCVKDACIFSSFRHFSHVWHLN